MNDVLHLTVFPLFSGGSRGSSRGTERLGAPTAAPAAAGKQRKHGKMEDIIHDAHDISWEDMLEILFQAFDDEPDPPGLDLLPIPLPAIIPR